MSRSILSSSTQIIAAVLVLACALSVDAKQKRTRHSHSAASKSAYCAGVTRIGDCPQEGCPDPDPAQPAARYDKELNIQKNRRSDPQTPVKQTIAWLRSLPENPKNFTDLGNRDALKPYESQKITVVAWALAATKQGAETSNCGLSDPVDCDVHIVLVDPALKNPTLANDEANSQTAEFTPRVRVDHPNFTQAKLEPLINPKWKATKKATKGKLLVRVTGLVMFDSYHAFHGALVRANDWEIHPVLHFEYCPSAQCTADSDQGWKDLDAE